MREFHSSSDIVHADLLLVGFDPESRTTLAEKINWDSTQGLLVEEEDLTQALSEKQAKTLLFYFDPDHFTEKLQLLEKIFDQNKSLSLLIYHRNLSLEQVGQLISSEKVFAIIDRLEALPTLLKKATEHYKDQNQYIKTLNQVKEQNKKLELFTVDLEKLVHERTKNEFVASQKMEKAVKAIQSLLTFIKTVSRCESIEDLLVHVRSEFKKIHGLMPPILLLSSADSGLRIFYFQGKQLTEKRVNTTFFNGASGNISDNDMRTELSNLLGRPFGSLSTIHFSFKSTELSYLNCSMIFEHSLGEKSQEDFRGYSKERWPIINMALENILLKEGLNNIAKQWARTFNQMEDPIIILDRSYRVTLSNFDFSNDKAGVFDESFVTPEQLKKHQSISETFNTGDPHTSDIHISNKVFRVHSYPIRLDGHKEVSHVINQYVDVTQSIDLQSRVIQSEKMAAVGLLAGNIAHELNNPLTGIFSLSELLLDDFEKESNTYKDLNEVKEAAARCQRIIKDLLDFSSVGEEAQGKKVGVNELIQKTLPLLKMAMRTLNSDIDLWESELNVQMNPQLLQQVIFNLINNACQAMDEGGVLKVVTREKPGFAEILVSDNGSGIPDEIQDSIFDPFFTTKEEGKGTGLGLSMSKSVVERAGGNLTLNHSNSNGTEFLIQLPLVDK